MTTITASSTLGIYLPTASLTNPVVVNPGVTISGSDDSIFAFAGSWTIQNHGRIGSTSTGTDGISLQGEPSTVVNYGTITGFGAAGDGSVYLGTGGLVVNQSGGVISSPSVHASAVYINGGIGTVINAGIMNAGVWLQTGGAVTNEAGAKIISGSTSGYGVGLYDGGSVTNAGQIGGIYVGIDASHLGGTVVNQAGGTIAGPFVGVLMATIDNPGTGVRAIINQAGATISGDSGFIAGGSAATVTNAGAISGTLAGTIIKDGFTLVVGAGVSMSAGGTVTNQSGGRITGASYGVYIGNGAGTVVNAGTIGGSSGAVRFAAGQADRLVVDPGAVFVGTVSGGNTIGATAVSTLELATGASTGTLSGLGTKYVDFGTIILDQGSDWLIAGNTSGLASTIVGFAQGDTIELTGVTATGSSFANGILTLDETSGAATLNFAGTFASGAFQVTNVSGGVEVTTSATVSSGVYDSSSLTNSGLVESVTLGAGAVLTNAATGLISNPSGIAVYSAATSAGVSVINAGGIASTAGNNHRGIELLKGGYVGNAATGMITAIDAAGVYIGGLAGTVHNAGLIATSGGTHAPVVFFAGGYLSNALTGTITAAADTSASGMYVTGGLGTLINAGQMLATGDGVDFRAGGVVTNRSTGTISSEGNISVYISGGPGTVVNAGLLSSHGSGGLSGVVLEAGGTVTNQATGTITSGGSNDVFITGEAGAVINGGKILNPDGAGVALDAGGSVTNQSTGTISGTFPGVYVKGEAGTVINAGNVQGSTTDGIDLLVGGSVTNQSTGTITGDFYGVLIFGAVGAVVNAGTIGASRNGVGLFSGGTVVDTGTISGGTNAVYLGAGFTNRLVVDPGAVFIGTVDGGNTIGADTVSTLELASGASAGTLSGLGTQFVNFGSIAFDTGADWFIAGSTSGLAGTISGFAQGDTIEITGITVTGSSFADGVLTLTEASGTATLDLPGTFTTGEFAVTNVAGGAEVSLMATGVGTTISASSTIGVVLTSPPYTNPVVIDPGVTISSSQAGISATTGSWTIQNGGSVAGNATASGGSGVSLGAGGSVTNQSTAAISGYVGIDTNSGGGALTVVNAGSILGNATAFGGAGIDIFDGGSVTNQSAASISGFTGISGGNTALTVMNGGIIAGSTTAVPIGNGAIHAGIGVLLEGGSVTNESSGAISGYFGIYSSGTSALTIVNAGRISGATTIGNGIKLDDVPASVTNQSGATISGGVGIADYLAALTVVNAGSIEGNAASSPTTRFPGVALRAGGSVTNQSSALISGGYIGIYAAAGSTVVNAGTISGGSGAVQFAAGNTNRLVVDPGAVFNGWVSGGNTIGAGAVSTLELASGASAGTLSGLGSQITNFGSIVFDTGAAWFVAGNASGLAGTISGFAAGDTIELIGVTAAGSSFSNGVLTLTEASGAATLDLPGTFTTGSFVVANVAGGVEVTTVGATGPSTWTWVGGSINVDSPSDWTLTAGPGNASGIPQPGDTAINTGTMVGDGTIAASLINNGTIDVSNNSVPSSSTGGELTIAGSISGAGTITIEPGATLQIDGSLGAGQTIAFAPGAPETLILETPATTVSAAITGFALGDRIEFGGASINSHSYNAGTLTVMLALNGGGSAIETLSNFALAAGTPASLTTSYDAVNAAGYLMPVQIITWTGAGDDTLFADPANWSPSVVPSQFDFADIDSASGGTISGSGTAGFISFYGPGQWAIASGTSLDATVGIYVANGPGSTGTLTVETGSTLNTTGGVLVGWWTGSNALLTIDSGGTVDVTGGSTNSPAMQIGGQAASGTLAASSGTVVVSGTGALLDLSTAGLWLGNSAGSSGNLLVAQGGSVIATTTNSNLNVSLAISQQGNGSLTVTDPGSEVTAQGEALIARSGTGLLTVENAATFLATTDPLGNAGLVVGGGGTDGLGGTGVANVLSGGNLISQGYITIGRRGTAGQVSVNGGTVQVGTVLSVGAGGTIAPGTVEAGSGTLSIGAGGTVELTGSAQAGTFGVNVASANDGVVSATNGIVTVSGTGADLNANGNGVGVGELGNGTLTVSAGGTLTAGTPNSSLLDALAVGIQAFGTVAVTDPGSSLTANGAAGIGLAGNGSLLVENSGQVTIGLDGFGNGGLSIGGGESASTIYAGGTGSVLVTTSGDLLSDTTIAVGQFAGNATLGVSNDGTVEVAQNLLIGVATTASAGSTEITGGGTTVLTGTTVFTGTGTVTVGAGGLLRVDDLGATGVPDIIVGDGGTGVLNVSGAGAMVSTTSGTIAIDGGGTLELGTGGSVQAGGVSIGNNGTLLFDGGEITLSGTSSNAGEVAGFGTFIGPLLNNGSVVVASGDLLEMAGSLLGSGNVQIGNGGTLRVDAAVASGQTISFGTDATLDLPVPGTAFANVITGLNTGDIIEFGNGMTITSASVVNGNTIAVDFHGSSGQAGTYDLTNVGFAAGSGQQFSVGVDATTGDSYVAVGVLAPTSESWLADVPGDFDDPTKWSAGVVPGPSTAATIDFADDPQVTHDTGADNVQSLTNTAGDFVMAGGTLTTTALANASQISWTGGSLVLNTGTSGLAATASLDNTAAATLAITPHGQSLTAIGTGTASLANAGTITVALASGTANIDVALTNTGEIVLDQGVLSLNGGGSTNAYLLQSTASGTLQFGTEAATGTGGTFTVTGGFYAVANTVVDGSVLDLSAATPITFADSLGVAAGSLILGAQDAADQGAFTQTGGTIAGSGTLTTYGVAALDGGVMTGGGTTQLLFTSTIGGTIALDGGDTLANAGRLNWSSGDIELGAGDPAAAAQSATLANAAGALLYVTADATIAAPGTAAAVTNAGGLVVYAGAGETAIDAALTNTGVIQLQSGTLSLNGGGSSSGSNIFASPGAVLQFGTTATGGSGTFSITGGLYQVGNTVVDGSTLDLSAASGAVFPDLLSVTAGALSLGALNATDQNVLQQTGGTIAGSGTLTVFGGSALTGGVQTGPGVTVLNGTSTLGGTFALDGGRTLANDGWLNWSSGGIALGSGAPGAVPQAGTLDNASVLYVTADGRLGVGSGGSGVVDNSGVLAVLAGAGVTNVDAALDNTGIVQLQSGTLSLNGGGSSAGNALFVAAGAVLQFGTAASGAGGTFSVTGAAYTVASTEVTGGTLDLSAAAGAGFGTSLSISGSGVVQLGTVTASVGALSLGAGGELAGSGFLFVGGNASLGAGLQTGSGATILTQDAAIGGGADLDGGRTLQNDATLVWSGGTLTLGGGDATLTAHSATLSNVAGAVFAIEADGTVVSAGSGLLANAGTIEKAGGLGVTTVAVAVNNTGTVDVSSGTLAFGQAVSGAGTFVLDGTAVLDLVGGAASGSAMTFLHPGGTLETAALGTFGAVVSGFASGDEIDVAGVGFVSGTTTVGFSGGTLTVSGGGQSASFALAGSYAAGAFTIGSDGHGGTGVTYG